MASQKFIARPALTVAVSPLLPFFFFFFAFSPPFLAVAAASRESMSVITMYSPATLSPSLRELRWFGCLLIGES